MRRRWHILREGDTLTLARHLPARFDVAARTVLPRARPLQLAHQVRQDLWRELRTLRGFSPVVRVEAAPDHLKITAGGRVEDRAPANTAARIAGVLEDPGNRARWVSHAREAR